jgi:CheY-like chemotaxis protein
MPEELLVLLAEDELVDEISLKRIFNNVRFFKKIDVVNNGAELLNYLNNCQSLPDIVITDSKMPILDGVSAIKQIRSNSAFDKILLVLISSSFSKEEIEIVTSLKNTLYFEKPANVLDYTSLAENIMKSISSIK